MNRFEQITNVNLLAIALLAAFPEFVRLTYNDLETSDIQAISIIHNFNDEHLQLAADSVASAVKQFLPFLEYSSETSDDNLFHFVRIEE